MARNKDRGKVSILGLILRTAALLFLGLLAAAAVQVAVNRISGRDSWDLSLADYLESVDYYYYEGDFAAICQYRDGSDFYDLPEFGKYLEAAAVWEEKEQAVHWWKAYARLGDETYRTYGEEHQRRMEEAIEASAYPENAMYFEPFRQEAEAARQEAEAARQESGAGPEGAETAQEEENP